MKKKIYYSNSYNLRCVLYVFITQRIPSEYLELYPVIGYIDSCQYSEEFNQYLFTGYYVFYHYGTKKAIKLVDWLSR